MSDEDWTICPRTTNAVVPFIGTWLNSRNFCFNNVYKDNSRHMRDKCNMQCEMMCGLRVRYVRFLWGNIGVKARTINW
jgi:hypothetical protein